MKILTSAADVDRWFIGLGSAPLRVALPARITSSNTFDSPLSGLRANAFVWQFSSRPPNGHPRRRARNGHRSGDAQRVAMAGTRQWGGALEVLAGTEQRIHVPWTNLSLVPTKGDPSAPLRSNLPSEVPVSPNLGLVLVSETSFAADDDVLVEGWLARTDGAAPFRSSSISATAPFTFRYDLGAVTLARRTPRSWPRRWIGGARDAFLRMGSAIGAVFERES